MVAILERRDVDTTLNYWAQHPGQELAVDLSHPSGDKRLSQVSQERMAAFPVKVEDIRGHEHEYTLEKDHVQIVHQELPDLAGLSKTEIFELLAEQAQELVKEVTGATTTFVQKYRLRDKSAEDDDNWNKAVGPAHGVHLDHTLEGALRKFRHRCEISNEDEKTLLKNGRVQYINVWRPLAPVKRDPFGWCDAKSFDPERDIAPFKFIHADVWNTMGSVVYNKEHKWKYLGHQKPEEILLFKQFDSKFMDGHAAILPHSAFVDPGYVNEAPRKSVEISVLAWKADAC